MFARKIHCGAVIISRRGAVFRDAVRAVRYFVTRTVSAPRAVRAVCAVRFFVTPLREAISENYTFWRLKTQRLTLRIHHSCNITRWNSPWLLVINGDISQHINSQKIDKKACNVITFTSLLPYTLGTVETTDCITSSQTFASITRTIPLHNDHVIHVTYLQHNSTRKWQTVDITEAQCNSERLWLFALRSARRTHPPIRTLEIFVRLWRWSGGGVFFSACGSVCRMSRIADCEQADEFFVHSGVRIVPVIVKFQFHFHHMQKQSNTWTSE